MIKREYYTPVGQGGPRISTEEVWRYVCPKCGEKLKRERGMYAWRGSIMHGWVCVPCNSLCDIGGAFIDYVLKRTGVAKEKRSGATKEERTGQLS